MRSLPEPSVGEGRVGTPSRGPSPGPWRATGRTGSRTSPPTVAQEVHRADLVLGAILFAVGHDPMRYSRGLTDRTDSLRVFTAHGVAGDPDVWVYLHVSESSRAR